MPAADLKSAAIIKDSLEERFATRNWAVVAA
jgi:hypothetical protein